MDIETDTNDDNRCANCVRFCCISLCKTVVDNIEMILRLVKIV